MAKKKSSTKKQAPKKKTTKKASSTKTPKLRVISGNPHSERNKRTFVDQMRGSAEFYEMMDTDFDNLEQFEFAMVKCIKQDPFFLDPYLQLHNMYTLDEQYEAAESYLEDAFQKALELILDDQDEWPDRMEWGWMENRHILRTIQQKAEVLWAKSELSMALYLFKKILNMNPNDNTASRFAILALLLEMDFIDFLEFSENEDGFLNHEIHDWFKKHSPKYPHVFRNLKEY